MNAMDSTTSYIIETTIQPNLTTSKLETTTGHSNETIYQPRKSMKRLDCLYYRTFLRLNFRNYFLFKYISLQYYSR